VIRGVAPITVLRPPPRRRLWPHSRLSASSGLVARRSTGDRARPNRREPPRLGRVPLVMPRESRGAGAHTALGRRRAGPDHRISGPGRASTSTWHGSRPLAGSRSPVPATAQIVCDPGVDPRHQTAARSPAWIWRPVRCGGMAAPSDCSHAGSSPRIRRSCATALFIPSGW